MQPFIQFEGLGAPLLQDNIDTDTIIPSREMKAVSKQGLAAGLFAAWRYRTIETREPDPDFVLNQTAYKDASILITGDNFGCGSSREHAVWALQEFGFQAIIGVGFGSIFFGNCINNGLLPITLARRDVQALAHAISATPKPGPIQINLPEQRIHCAEQSIDFELEQGPREALIAGLDPIDATLLMRDKIEAFESRDRVDRSWAYLQSASNDAG